MSNKLIKDVAVIIPVYNNKKTVADVVKSVLHCFETVIVVDDGSDIEVRTLIQNGSIILLRHENNMGKGKGLITGFKEAERRGFKQVVTIDADGQHDIQDILPHIRDIRGHNNTLFIGDRNMDTDNVPLVSKFGKKNSNFWIFLETFCKIGDSQCGYRVYPVSLASQSYLTDGFDFETEVIVKHIWNRGEVVDFPVKVVYFPESERVSHFDKKRDNIKISWLHAKLMVQRYILLKGFLW